MSRWKGFKLNVDINKDINVDTDINQNLHLDGNVATAEAEADAVGYDTFTQSYTDTFVLEDYASSSESVSISAAD